MIQAMKDVDAVLVIVGDGPLRKQLEEQAKALGNRVQFLGAKTHSELRTVFASADILVIPSVTAKDGDQEGLPTVIMEGFASKLPVVATNTGGIADVVISEKNGLLVEEKNVEQLAEAINKLLLDEVLYKQISEEAYETSKSNDYSKIAEKYSEVIEGAMKRYE